MYSAEPIVHFRLAHLHASMGGTPSFPPWADHVFFASGVCVALSVPRPFSLPCVCFAPSSGLQMLGMNTQAIGFVFGEYPVPSPPVCLAWCGFDGVEIVLNAFDLTTTSVPRDGSTATFDATPSPTAENLRLVLDRAKYSVCCNSWEWSRCR